MDAAAKLRRATNREGSTKLLLERGVTFTTHNNGCHLIVQDGDRLWDFWPGTGKWQERTAGSRTPGRGVFRLLKLLRAHRFTTPPTQEQGNAQETSE